MNFVLQMRLVNLDTNHQEMARDMWVQADTSAAALAAGLETLREYDNGPSESILTQSGSAGELRKLFSVTPGR